MTTRANGRRRGGKARVPLDAPGWAPAVRARLVPIIRAGAGRGLPVVFDFDNTLVWGDIGEATLATLVHTGTLRAGRVEPHLRRPFRSADGVRHAVRSAGDILRYYESLLAPTVHGVSDPTPLANGYVWAVQVMAGLTPVEVMDATEAAVASAKTGEDRRLADGAGGMSYPIPFFYPEMVELLGSLLRHGYEVWIVSASNVWTVRWMVAHRLNPLLQASAGVAGVRPDRVLGLATLLEDGDGRLHKDAVLVRDRPDYATLDREALARFRLTDWLQFPVPVYSGKVGCLQDHLGQPPYLGAGDSPSDLAMLSWCRHRLWLSRLDKPDYRRAAEAVRGRAAGSGNWLIQPVVTRDRPGLVHQ